MSNLEGETKTMRKISQEELKQILEKHKIYITTSGKEGERAYLSWADLSGANLRGANLSGANLEGAIVPKNNS